MSQSFKSGFIAMVGRPNVGKSTLMNHIIGRKISIISDKPQTTRNRIQGIYTDEHVQMVFIDTPGIHRPKHRLGDQMVRIAEGTLEDVDVILFLVDAKGGYGAGDQYIMDRLDQVNTPVFLLLNKIDLIHPNDLLPLIDLYQEKGDFKEIIPVSALDGNNVNRLLEVITNYLPEGPKYYEEDQWTDHSEEFLIREFIREKILEFTREEVPHSVTVEIETMEDRGKRPLYIQASIITERETQKGILIGKKGQMLKKIGQKARTDIESFLGQKVYLELWVKVQKDWRNNERFLNQFGLHSKNY